MEDNYGAYLTTISGTMKFTRIYQETSSEDCKISYNEGLLTNSEKSTRC